MATVTKIHQNANVVRRHYLNEWMELREMSAADLVNLLNDPERSSDLPYTDKSQVYRWMKGQLPQPAALVRLAAIFGFEDDPSKLLRPPTIDWFNQFFKDRTEEELKRMKTALEASFPRELKSGSEN